ncbi:TfuA-like protein [Microvirga sp. 2YAF29]|uniref:TfuA-like protein n=1 Tax=Microvirga sp. 2YAF29 TaxID=3233031 RepID=UPI003F9CEC32
MSIVIFCGPTISAAEVREHLDAICLPPAGYGDVIRAAKLTPRPCVIAIIDGMFRSAPAVRHKEILWALSEGIHVFGAASMGALRAAELCDHGMVGIGSIFSDYRNGKLEDDDEVAIEHGPSELNFMPLSEAMVDIRATVDAAVRHGVIDRTSEEYFLNQAKRRFYPERCWEELFKCARNSVLDGTMIDALQAWIPTGKVCRKRDDAIELLTAIRSFMASDPPPFTSGFLFERTDVWDLDYEAANTFPKSIASEVDALPVDDVLDELRLSPADYMIAQREALLRVLSIREAQRHGVAAEQEEKENALREWLRERGMGLQEALEKSGLDEIGLGQFLSDEALVRWTAERLDPVTQENLLGALRSHGTLAPFIQRAHAKRQALRSIGKEGSTTQTSAQSPAAMLGWFWRRKFPGQMLMMSPAMLAQKLGFSDVSAMNRALLREYLFSDWSRRKSTAPDRVD